jgi:hypothetical protein
VTASTWFFFCATETVLCSSWVGIEFAVLGFYVIAAERTRAGRMMHDSRCRSSEEAACFYWLPGRGSPRFGGAEENNIVTKPRTAVSWGLAFAFAAASAAWADPIPAPPVLPTPEPHVVFSSGDGSSCREAVVITGTSHEPEGVRAERWWIFTKNAGAKIAGQSASEQGGKDLETIDLVMPDGRHKSICFDISSFYGKP